MTKSYSAVHGDTVWTQEHKARVGTYGVDLMASPSGDSVYVVGVDMTGTTRNYRTIKYDAETGEVVWTAAADVSDDAGNEDNVNAAVVGPSGWIYVTGGTQSDGDEDMATVAYSPGPQDGRSP